MRLLFTILFLLSFSAKGQQILRTRFSSMQNAYPPPVTPPTPDPGEIDSLVINYNTAAHTYNASYPGKNIINFVTAVPNYFGAGLAANTGLIYRMSDNRLVVTTADNSQNERLFKPNLVLYDSLAATTFNQGLAYNAITGDYYWLRPDSISIRNGAGAYVGKLRLVFPYTQENPGMVEFDIWTNKFYTSYDDVDTVYIWQADFTAGTLTSVNKLFIDGAGEGVSLNQNDRTILVNLPGSKRTYDSTGTLLKTFTFSGATGNVIEGLAMAPDGTAFFNSDEGYHGLIDGGNRLWHFDPYSIYNKWLKFPQQLRWTTGKLSGVTIAGVQNRSYLTGDGYWISPIIDFGTATRPADISNWLMYGGGALQWRGSNDPPTTTATNDYTPFSFWDANLTSDGWGSTTPSAFYNVPGAYRYLQFKIFVDN